MRWTYGTTADQRAWRDQQISTCLDSFTGLFKEGIMTRLYVIILCGVALADNPEGKQGFVEDQVKFLKVGRDCFIFSM